MSGKGEGPGQESKGMEKGKKGAEKGKRRNGP